MSKYHKTSTEQKILWLLANPKLWENYEYQNMKQKRELFIKMQEAKLYSITTYWMDARIEELILAAKERKEK